MPVGSVIYGPETTATRRNGEAVTIVSFCLYSPQEGAAPDTKYALDGPKREEVILQADGNFIVASTKEPLTRVA